MKHCLCIVLMFASLMGCTSTSTSTEDGAGKLAGTLIKGEVFDQSMQVLASDELEGRKPFTAGEAKTIAYLQKAFAGIGLQPGNDTSFLQQVPMVEIKSEAARTLTVQEGEHALSFNFLDDYVAGSRRVQPEVSLNNSEMVFVGYGIVAPEFGWNDYAGVDVKGKTVVVLVNDPGFFDSSLFKGRTMTYYGRWTYKFEEAARQGAAGVFIVHDTKPASYDWPVVRSSWSKSRLYLNREDGNMNRCAVEGWLSMETAKKVLALAGQPDSIFAAAGKKGFNPVPLQLKASITVKNNIKESHSYNVLALLPGTE